MLDRSWAGARLKAIRTLSSPFPVIEMRLTRRPVTSLLGKIRLMTQQVSPLKRISASCFSFASVGWELLLRNSSSGSQLTKIRARARYLALEEAGDSLLHFFAQCVAKLAVGGETMVAVGQYWRQISGEKPSGLSCLEVSVVHPPKCAETVPLASNSYTLN